LAVQELLDLAVRELIQKLLLKLLSLQTFTILAPSLSLFLGWNPESSSPGRRHWRSSLWDLFPGPKPQDNWTPFSREWLFIRFWFLLASILSLVQQHCSGLPFPTSFSFSYHVTSLCFYPSPFSYRVISLCFILSLFLSIFCILFLSYLYFLRS
jgi:hypothetical protein